VVVLLLPLSLAMDDGEFDHGGGGGGGGGPAAASAAAVAAVAVAAVDNDWRCNESIDCHMMACNDKCGRQKTTQQPTNDGRSKGRQW
jgi:hypothetical protein